MKEPLEKSKSFTQKIGLILGPALFFAVLLFADLDPQKPTITAMAAVAILMAVWWITHAIPLFATALLPIILFPTLGILKSSSTAPIYLNSIVFLFLGGLMIALTMEKWNLHKRIALFIINLIGGGSSRIILGFMAASGFLSMWIANTATALMMVPIGLAVILKMEEKFSIAQTYKFTTCLMLSIAYGSSIGGMATLVGTPPNLVFSRIFQIIFPEAPLIEFGSWFAMGLPISITMILIAWLMLTKIFFRVPSSLTIDKTVINKEYRELGPMSFEEKSVLTVFSLTAFLWVFRKKLTLGVISIPGWSQLMPHPAFIDDATVAITMAMIMFFIPTRTKGAPYKTIMGLDVVQKLPWHIVLLFGGGFALAKGFQITGLAEFVGGKFSTLEGTPIIVMIAMICLGLTFLTELTSNTAVTEMIMPILASVAISAKINPLLIMIPATLSASCAFMMPVATPPNAVVFGSGRIKISEMVRVGIFLNLIGVVVITTLFYLLGTAIFAIDPNIFPEWAHH